MRREPWWRSYLRQPFAAAAPGSPARQPVLLRLVDKFGQVASRLAVGHPYGNVFPNSGRKFRTFIGKSFPAMGLRAEH
jgi:hypothetical protein